jgi:hypothetical protein
VGAGLAVAGEAVAILVIARNGGRRLLGVAEVVFVGLCVADFAVLAYAQPGAEFIGHDSPARWFFGRLVS